MWTGTPPTIRKTLRTGTLARRPGSHGCFGQVTKQFKASKCLKYFLTTAISQAQAYTFVVYCASAIYTPSEVGVMEEFNVGIPKAALGLSMYVLGYGFGKLENDTSIDAA